MTLVCYPFPVNQLLWDMRQKATIKARKCDPRHSLVVLCPKVGVAMLISAISSNNSSPVVVNPVTAVARAASSSTGVAELMRAEFRLRKQAANFGYQLTPLPESNS